MIAATRAIDATRAGLVDYTEAWEWQQRLHEERVEGIRPDSILLLEHPSVYTAGKQTRPEDRPTDGTPVIEVDRGGRITWHGPGQLVGYPIVKLAEPLKVARYVRALESLLIAVCAKLGVATIQVPGRSGVWVDADARGPQRKVAALGLRVRRGVTMHGFALNCDPDLSAFDAIVPCGLNDVGVTSLSRELGRHVSVAEATELIEALLDDHLLPILASRPAG